MEKGEEGMISQCVSILSQIVQFDEPYRKLDSLMMLRHALLAALRRRSSTESSEGAAATSSMGNSLKPGGGGRRGHKRSLSKIVLCADDLIPIFSLSIIRAGVPNMHAELDFVESFLDERMSFGEAAYCLTTVRVALEAIELLPTDR
eukprot:TRINITY_DN8978_c0_g2_i1.p2 TRINITY_DN8978_c0_g2~~TRINITY_DN8978_c0_g2_i1.p2  ORF type:complete len:147 (+),score=46.58 TRINITY_DN8978_c0_g2_i1:202-642(+)